MSFIVLLCPLIRVSFIGSSIYQVIDFQAHLTWDTWNAEFWTMVSIPNNVFDKGYEPFSLLFLLDQ